jgi:hypothetical protein
MGAPVRPASNSTTQKTLLRIPKNSIGINMLRLTYWHWGKPTNVGQIS